MFNRQSFNRGKFNRTTTQGNRVIFDVDMYISLDTTTEINIAQTFEASINMALYTQAAVNYSAIFKSENIALSLSMTAQMSRTKPFEKSSKIAIGTTADMTRRRIFAPQAIEMLLSTTVGIIQTWRTEHISIPGLQVPTGGELVIDMDNQTVTLNGQNVMRFVDRHSDFFRFLPGINEVTYTNSVPASMAEIRILWHDAWL